MWRIREKLEDIYYWFKEGNGRLKFILQIVLTLGMVVLFLGIPLGWYEEDKGEVAEGVIDTNINSIDINEFEILKAEELYTNSNKFSVLKIDILFKNGELSSEYAQEILKFVFNQFRNKSKNEGKELIAFEINAYVSKIEYFRGITPDGNFSKYIDGSLYNSIIVGDTFLEDYLDKNGEEYNVLFEATINYNNLKKREDYIVLDGDDVEVFKIDLGPYYTDAELSTIYKLHEYISLFNSSNKNKAFEFYVYFDLGVPYDTYKHASLSSKYSMLYQEFGSIYRYRLPSIDSQQLAEHYRKSYPNLWSELVVKRGY